MTSGALDLAGADREVTTLACYGGVVNTGALARHGDPAGCLVAAWHRLPDGRIVYDFTMPPGVEVEVRVPGLPARAVGAGKLELVGSGNVEEGEGRRRRAPAEQNSILDKMGGGGDILQL